MVYKVIEMTTARMVSQLFEKQYIRNFKKKQSSIINIMDTEIPDIQAGILEPIQLDHFNFHEDIKIIINTKYPIIELNNSTKRIIWMF